MYLSELTVPLQSSTCRTCNVRFFATCHSPSIFAEPSTIIPYPIPNPTPCAEPLLRPFFIRYVKPGWEFRSALVTGTSYAWLLVKGHTAASSSRRTCRSSTRPELLPLGMCVRICWLKTAERASKLPSPRSVEGSWSCHGISPSLESSFGLSFHCTIDSLRLLFPAFPDHQIPLSRE